MSTFGGGCAHKSAFCKRGSLNVRFAPKATEVLRCRELTLRANVRSWPRPLPTRWPNLLICGHGLRISPHCRRDGRMVVTPSWTTKRIVCHERKIVESRPGGYAPDCICC